MSLVALIMNLLLGALLVAALGLGWRLERRLKALRDSQTSFAAAIADLDRAATRAEQGLADLRAATNEANEALAGRIERAQVLTQRLDGAMTRAAAAPAREPPQNREFSRDPATRAEQLAARLELGLPREEAPRRAEPLRPEMPRAREVRTDLILEDDDVRRPFSPRTPLSRAPVAAPTPQPHRSRARVDDDLFEDRGDGRTPLGGAPPRTPLGGRR
jgi:hypothetical protein